MDFANSLRSSRGSGATPRGSLHANANGSPSNARGMGLSVTPGTSPSSHHHHSHSSSSARSSPSHANSMMQRRGSASASASAASSNNTDYLQRAAISNSYSSTRSTALDDETSSNVSESLSLQSGLMRQTDGTGSPMSVGSRSGSMLGSGGGGGLSERGGNFKVVIRVRPPLPRELHNDRPFQNVIHVDSEGHVLTVSENLASVQPSGTGSGTPTGNSGGGNGGGGGSSGGGSGGDADLGPPGAYGSHVFSFDHVYDQHCTQRVVYENTAKAVVESSLEGYNATIFAYGQTGTGKTYTMEGFNSGSGASAVEERGIIPRAIEQIFQHIQSNMSARMRFLVRASYLQIYNESISDLLKPERNNLTIREDKKRGVFVEGLSEWVVRSPEEIYGLMERGGAMRATGSTKMNEISSRSHAVFIIIAEQSKTAYADAKGNDISPEEFTALVNAYQARNGGGGGGNGTTPGQLHPKLESMVRQSFKVGKLNLVDLAGSERVRLSGATGQRLEESKKINQSLSALGNVIAALTDARGRQHIPYRDSKLTRILEDSLGGNCKTTMMAMISPALEAITESLSTLKFANRAKSIKNEARVNEDLDQKSLLRKYERELKRLRAELEEKSRNVVDKRRLLELDEQRRRAEEDKMAAIRALEERSREFMREKEEKKKLEERIATLMSQMLTSSQRRSGAGGANGLTASVAGGRMTESGDAVFMAMGGEGGAVFDAEDPILRDVLKEHQDRIRQEYEIRLADLEKERESIEEEKAQVDRYKQLLLKQRDIMIALTQRLNERDEQITALQDELDAYDRHQKELEEKLDEKTAHLIHLQRVTLEQTGGTKGSDWNTMTAGSTAETSGAFGAARPELLITHKQYRAHTQDSPSINIASGRTARSDGGSDLLLLSAEEKILELSSLLENHAADQQRFAKELEDVKAEKVSVEYLLRDRLEKLVQVEMEARMKSMAWNQQQQVQDQMHKIKLQMEALESENRRLKDKDAHESVGGGYDPQQAVQLQARCDTLVKERRAVQTIMEQKIKTLVTAISDASEATFQSVGGAEQLGEPAKWLAKEVNALQRLVNASIVALRNAESSNQATHSGSATPASSAGKVSANSDTMPSQQAVKTPATRTVDLTGNTRALAVPSPAASITTSSVSAPVPLPPMVTSTSGMSVDELIQQRRAQLQRERQAH